MVCVVRGLASPSAHSAVSTCPPQAGQQKCPGPQAPALLGSRPGLLCIHALHIPAPRTHATTRGQLLARRRQDGGQGLPGAGLGAGRASHTQGPPPPWCPFHEGKAWSQEAEPSGTGFRQHTVTQAPVGRTRLQARRRWAPLQPRPPAQLNSFQRQHGRLGPRQGRPKGHHRDTCGEVLTSGSGGQRQA